MKFAENLKVRDVMTRSVITVAMDSSVRDVIKTLAKEDITGVVVIEPKGGIMGIISEMDIVKAFNEDLDKLTAEDIMADNVKTIKPESTIKDAADIMKKEKVHRLVIVHEKGSLGIPSHPIGILSASDIVHLIAKK
jgi:CBS domain-containing protein